MKLYQLWSDHTYRAFETKENVVINQNNNVGLSVANKEYIDLQPFTDTTKENKDLNLDSETGLKVSRQDYIEIKEVQ